MNPQTNERFAQAALLLFGVIPTGLVVFFLGPMGLCVGVVAAATCNLKLALLAPWVLGGIFGVVGLFSSSVRFDARHFKLKGWERWALICGWIACVPFPFYFHDAGPFDRGLLIYYVPISLSAISAATIVIRSQINSRRMEPAEIVSTSQ